MRPDRGHRRRRSSRPTGAAAGVRRGRARRSPCPAAVAGQRSGRGLGAGDDVTAAAELLGRECRWPFRRWFGDRRPLWSGRDSGPPTVRRNSWRPGARSAETRPMKYADAALTSANSARMTASPGLLPTRPLAVATRSLAFWSRALAPAGDAATRSAAFGQVCAHV